MKRIQLHLTDEQARALSARAATVDRPVAALVRDAIDRWLGDEERRLLAERAFRVIGVGHSGLGDLAENHDAYVDEVIDEPRR